MLQVITDPWRSERKRKQYTCDVILTSLTGACPISALEQHQIVVMRAAFTFMFSFPINSKLCKRNDKLG